jgi:hypothetical protein
VSGNDAAWLAELLTEIESDPDDITRLRLIHALREVLGAPIDVLLARFYGDGLAARREETTMTSAARRDRFQLVHA